MIATDGVTDGGLDRHRNTPVPATGLPMDHFAMAHHVHWENAVFIETTQPAQRDDRLVGHAKNIAQVLVHIDEGDVTQIFAIALVHCAG